MDFSQLLSTLDTGSAIFDNGTSALLNVLDLFSQLGSGSAA